MRETLETPASGRLRYGGLFAGALTAIVFLLLPLPEGLDERGRAVMATTALMAIWWMTEALPIPVTALLPLILFPLFDVMSMPEVAIPYGHHLVFLFLGGFVLALAVERSGLHRRIAIRIILIVGERPSRLVLGFMLATAALSMWISNTATVMLMLPIALAVIEHVRSSCADDADPVRGKGNFAIALLLGIAYAASIGGVATLIGTPPNIVLAGVLAKLYPEAPDISFVRWMMFGVPVAALFLPLAWLLLVHVLPGSRIGNARGAAGARLSTQTCIALPGLMSRDERLVLLVFLLTAAGWMFRVPLDLGFTTLPGLTMLFPRIGDSTVAMISAVLLFLLPGQRGGAILTWKEVRHGLPWGILLLFGGGFALAEGMRDSGVTLWLGNLFTGAEGLPLWLLLLLICGIFTFTTELTSNTATAAILLPVLASTAVSFGYHPLMFMVPAAFSASFAFMLPVATPPNAIVFSSSMVSIRQMAATGLLLNLIGVLLITVMMLLLGVEVFGIDNNVLPVWAR
ncbi:MAG: SLC13/DASS family transporter [Bacteroidetes bacterium]|nr:SLC13/DASS family transporter [Bacteroidota bacterium]